MTETTTASDPSPPQRMLCNLHGTIMVGTQEYLRHCSEEHDGSAIAVVFLAGEETDE